MSNPCGLAVASLDGDAREFGLPASRYLAPPSWHMLFAVDTAGVRSQA